MHGKVPTSSPAAPLGPGMPLAPDFPWRKYFSFTTPELLREFASNVGTDSVDSVYALLELDKHSANLIPKH